MWFHFRFIRTLQFGIFLFSIGALIGCNALNAPPSPTPFSITPIPNPTIVVVSPAPTQFIPPPTPTSPPIPTQPLPTLAPTTAPTRAITVAPTRAVTVAPTPAPASFTRVKIFLIAINDTSAGAPVGCGDSAVGVERQIPPTPAPLTAALNELFSLHDQFYGQSGLYNALYQSNLHLQRVAIVNGTATIQLTGNLTLGGECDNPRVAAQITQTARQFSTVRAVVVTLNGKPLEQVLSEK